MAIFFSSSQRTDTIKSSELQQRSPTLNLYFGCVEDRDKIELESYSGGGLTLLLVCGHVGAQQCCEAPDMVEWVFLCGTQNSELEKDLILYAAFWFLMATPFLQVKATRLISLATCRGLKCVNLDLPSSATCCWSCSLWPASPVVCIKWIR